MDAVRAVVGDDYETARLISGAEKLLSRYDGACAHLNIADMPSEN